MSDENKPAESAPKKSRKGLIITIASVLVLGGGGAGAYVAFAGKGEGEEKEAEKPAEAVAKLPAQFVAMDPPFVVNFQPGSQARFLQVAVQLMTRDLEMVHFIEHLKPIVRNDLLLLFGNKAVAEVATPEGKEALRMATLEAVRKIIAAEGGKPEALEAVYFTSFVMQ
jgi:flagellar FliL protein